MPSSDAARNARIAISPRLATSTFDNMRTTPSAFDGAQRTRWVHLARIPALRCSGGESFQTVLRTPSCRWGSGRRSEEHTSELQSRGHLVCRLLLEKKKNARAETRLRRVTRE